MNPTPSPNLAAYTAQIQRLVALAAVDTIHHAAASFECGVTYTARLTNGPDGRAVITVEFYTAEGRPGSTYTSRSASGDGRQFDGYLRVGDPPVDPPAVVEPPPP